MTGGEDEAADQRWTALAHHAALVALFAAVAIISTWPLARRLGDSLPRGREPVATVPLFNAWTIWWNFDRAGLLYAEYWNAPIFHPVKDSFAFSEPMPLTVVAWPLWAATGNLTLTYNVLLLTALTWNGYSGFQLARRLVAAPWMALVGGVMIETLPFAFNESGVFQLVPLFGIIYVVIGVDALSQAPSLRRAILLGASFALTYHLCTYYALFLAVAAPIPALVLLGRSLPRWRTWTLLTVSGAVAVALSLPTLWVQRRVSREHDMRRPVSLVQELSARETDYLAAPWGPWLYPQVAGIEPRFHIRLSPGALKYALAAAGAIYGLGRQRTRRWTMFLLALVVAAFLLSLGLNLKIGGWAPYASLMAWLPGFAQARNVFRFAVFVQLGIVLLSVLGLEAITQLAGAGNAAGRPWRRRAPIVAAAMAAIAALAELWPPQQFLCEAPSNDKNVAWLSWLETNTPRQSIIACVPFPQGTGVEDYESTTVWMYWQSFHRRRMVNGYSGFFPPSFLKLKGEMAAFPSEASLTALSQAGADFIVADRRGFTPNPFSPGTGLPSRLTPVFQDDEANVDIYRLSR
jgi:hypothetical protein